MPHNLKTTDTKVTINFHIEHYQGTMGLKISSADKVLFDCSEFQEEKFRFTTDLQIPGELRLDVYNKGQFDTQVDEHNNIIRDKHIKIEGLTIDRMPVPQDTFYKLFKLVHSNGENQGPYFGVNGSCCIPFDTSNTFEWHMNVRANVQS